MDEQIAVERLLVNFITEAQKPFSSADEDRWIKFLKLVLDYIGEDRLPYGDITESIYEVDLDKLHTIQENLTRIMEKANDLELSSVVKTNFKRFEDHINLAVTQKTFILKNINNLESQIEQKSDELKSLTDDLKEARIQVKTIRNIKTTIYTEFVTILGIFTAVVIGVFGSFQVIGSVFSNIKEVSTGKLLVFSSLTSMGVIITLFLLMKWINKVIHQDNGINKWGFSIKENNIFISSLMILFYIFVLGFLLYANEPKETILGILSDGHFGMIFFLILTLLTLLGVFMVFKNNNKKSD